MLNNSIYNVLEPYIIVRGSKIHEKKLEKGKKLPKWQKKRRKSPQICSEAGYVFQILFNGYEWQYTNIS